MTMIRRVKNDLSKEIENHRLKVLIGLGIFEPYLGVVSEN